MRIDNEFIKRLVKAPLFDPERDVQAHVARHIFLDRLEFSESGDEKTPPDRLRSRNLNKLLRAEGDPGRAIVK